ncbi:MAG TPA: hypothetical protein EYP14_03830 [Planctomycetaceae bacterium]|nr:hypothetical protein [Planctomycetaceae bacterium]
MPTDRVDLRNRYLAAALAFLLPGLGHFYQRRWFKGTIYSVCILTTFFWGMHLGRWQIVYFRWERGNKTVGYLSQVFVGLPALPALVQSWRYGPQEGHFGRRGPGRRSELDEPIEAAFRGRFVPTGPGSTLPEGPVEGRIQLRPVPGDFGDEVRGVFTGMAAGRADVVLSLSGPVEISPRLYASEGIPAELLGDEAASDSPAVFVSHRRYVKCEVIDAESAFQSSVGYLEGTIARPFWNWFEVPLEEPAKQDLHRRLGKFVELAQILTWIAGLLNLLAIWDALEGPAYGYGDEKDDEEQQRESADGSSKKRPRETPEGEKADRGSGTAAPAGGKAS